ncbi:unnamed protein product [Auanema sp. JU1783]|nr:unnamed protein product [Auanema sp. JU1783]
MSFKDYQKLTGNYIKTDLAVGFGHVLLEPAVDSIGLEELRAVLKLPPPHPWQPYNWNGLSENDFASAPTIEAYYNLKEPRSFERSLDGPFFETTVATAIAYLDKRMPSIRAVFRKAFEKTRRSHPGELNKKTIDHMIDEFFSIHKRMDKATKVAFSLSSKCW